MHINDMHKKGLIICTICILMLACFPSSGGKFVDDQKKAMLIGDRGTIKHGFIIGPYDSSTL
jgi:hypothetical protein